MNDFEHDRRAEILYYLRKGFKVRVPLPVGWSGDLPLKTIGLPIQALRYKNQSLFAQLSGGYHARFDGSFDFSRGPQTWLTVWYDNPTPRPGLATK